MKNSVQKKSIHLESEAYVFNELGRANLVIDQFIRSCSHSMRGPLKSIRGLVNLMRDDIGGKEISPDMLIKFIEESADKMETMLDELEQFMVNSMKSSKRKEVVMNELIGQSVTTLQKEIKKQSIEVSVRVDQCCPFLSDGSRIRLILNHLISNAITFQKPGNSNKRIEIACSISPSACVLAIKDNGIGIEANQHYEIFNLFYRATAQSSGAGIGLFVVREALAKIEGIITVESEPEEGSIFTVTIPNR